ncbi:MAG: TRAP transporter small permease subunit [Deltaproteobacteria bacterium]|nr:MAG: TRAP transporter small permease subunit [Deltaproteobacteria bacterium]
MAVFEKITRYLNRGLIFVGGVFLAAMVVLTCANIAARIVWIPIKGTFELMGFFGAVITAFALGYTQFVKGHIAVDVLVNRFSSKTQKITGIINCALCCVFFVMAAWQIAAKATTLWRTGEVTETLRIIYYPFTYAVAVGCAVLALVLVVELFKSVLSNKEGDV